MELKMWRRVLLVLFVVGRVSGAGGNNKEVFDKLCNITMGVKGLMKQNLEGKVSLQEALYGETGKARFNEDGVLTGGCGLHIVSRSQYCSHLTGTHPRGSTNPGCFGHSLLGTFLCLCTKGNNGEKDLCGFGEVTRGAGWSGMPSDDHVTTLFKDAWGAIKNKCAETSNKADTSALLRDLESAVEEIKDNTENNKLTSGTQGGYYLGGSPNGHCSRNQPQHGCVTYPEKTGAGTGPNIPWADKILTAITIINTQQQTSSSKSTSDPDSQHSTDGHEDLSPRNADDEEVEEESEKEEGEKESVESPGPQDPSKPSRPKRKRRSTNNQPTEQPAEPIRAILHDDGSFLPQPFWLLSAVF